MIPHVNAIATWVSIITVVIGGGIWVGSQGNETQANKVAIEKVDAQVDKLRNEGPPAIAVLQAQVNELSKNIDEVKDSQKEILGELRKKK